MTNRVLVQSLVCLMFTLSCRAAMFAAEPVDVLDLVSPDSALCLQIRQFDKTLASMESSGLLSRLGAYKPFEQWLKSDIVKKWQRIEQKFLQKTGRSLATLVRSLGAKSMVLSLRLPIDGVPEGVLIMESVDDDVIPNFIKIWNEYETETVTVGKSHHGLQYFQRIKPAAPNQTLYFATLAKWFAISSQESCIQDLIDRYALESNRPAQFKSTENILENKSLSQSRERLGADVDLFLHINARPWDQAIEELSSYWQLGINLLTVWKHVGSISSSLRLDRELICDATIGFHQSDSSKGWQQVVKTASAENADHAWVPPEAMLVFGSQLEFKPLYRFFVNQLSPVDVDRLSRIQRSAQSLLGTEQPIEVVLSSFATNFSGYFLERDDKQLNVPQIDGVLNGRFDDTKSRNLEANFSRALESVWNLRAASLSADLPRIITVKREISDSKMLEWLSEPVSFPSAFGISEHRLVLAGSEQSLREALSPPIDRRTIKHRSQELRQRYSQANQFVWLDSVIVRRLLQNRKLDIVRQLSADSFAEASHVTNVIDLVTENMSLFDSMFIACQVDIERIQLTFHGGLGNQ